MCQKPLNRCIVYALIAHGEGKCGGVGDIPWYARIGGIEDQDSDGFSVPALSWLTDFISHDYSDGMQANFPGKVLKSS